MNKEEIKIQDLEWKIEGKEIERFDIERFERIYLYLSNDTLWRIEPKSCECASCGDTLLEIKQVQERD